jgi:hypothetical protein
MQCQEENFWCLVPTKKAQDECWEEVKAQSLNMGGEV